MTDAEASAPSPSADAGTSPALELPPPDVPARAGEPAPPGSSEGRAHSFRERQTQRRSRKRELVGQLLVVAIIIVGIYAIVSARPFLGPSGPNWPSGGTTVTVNLTRPVVGTVTCGNGGTAYTQRTVWANASTLVSAENFTPIPKEPDTDPIWDHGVIANATPSSLCAGAPPSGGSPYFSWYVVLSAPNGTNLLTYTNPPGWVSVTGGPTDIPMLNGTSLTVVTNVPIPQGCTLWLVGSYGSSLISAVVAFA